MTTVAAPRLSSRATGVANLHEVAFGGIVIGKMQKRRDGKFLPVVNCKRPPLPMSREEAMQYLKDNYQGRRVAE